MKASMLYTDLDIDAILLEMVNYGELHIPIVKQLYGLPIILLSDSNMCPLDLTYDFFLNSDFEPREIVLIRDQLGIS
jgi:hypothetical protein